MIHEAKTRRLRNDQRSPLPRVLFMDMQRDLNRGFTQHELEIFKNQDLAEAMRQQRIANDKAEHAARARDGNAA